MTMKRIFAFIAGLLTICAGVYCMMTPEITWLSTIWLLGVIMFVNAFDALWTWSDRKQLGFANGWDLVAAFLALLFAVALMASWQTQFITGITLLYMTGIPLQQVMLISGHKDEDSIRHYLRLTKQENAEKLKDNPFFNQ